MERLGYILFIIGTLGFAGLLVYGAYLTSGIMPALIVLFSELISIGIILKMNA